MITVTKERFLDWRIGDSDDFEELGRRAFESLSYEGFSLISVEDLFHESGYIPARICKGYDGDGDDDLDPQDVTLID